ncbi:MAG: oxygen-independent coproporphyrinogen III oxidase [Oligoflexia bacterium]|nr:oxygen-independent coproporphyrinogen III oxidase [Oligoflexia bacterium]
MTKTQIQRPLPRYTSYPPITSWNGDISEASWISNIKEHRSEEGLDLYLHIPFCESLCFYCGCNRTITKKKSRGTDLVDALLKEWKMYLDINPNLKPSSIHFGGGTPTFLEVEDLRRLLIGILGETQNSHVFKAIEIDPRVTTLEHLKLLKEFNFNKISLGVQDFSLEVQKNINRIQSFELVKDFLENCPEGLEEINFDLIYGLPGQTIETMQMTLDYVDILKPTSIAFYQYAHMPSRLKNQRAIDESLLPSLEEREAIHDLGRDFLSKNNYKEIGFDHYALEDSLLWNCEKKRELKRNFMGFTHQKAPILIGLGPTSISKSQKFHVQNEKKTENYYQFIENGKFPLIFGHKISEEDTQREGVIMELMCNGIIDTTKVPELSKKAQKEFNELLSADYGSLKDNLFTINQKGRIHLRSIATIFDGYLN